MLHIKKFTIYTMSLLYIIVGVKHFIDPQFFINIVPPFLIFKKEIVYVSGLMEIVLGIFLLFKRTRTIGAWGIILLLILVFPANIYLYLNELPRELLHISKEQALIRMPFQIPLIVLAFWHSKQNSSKNLSLISILLFVPTIIYFITL